jgi:exodeoxyribonuclease X
METKMLPVNCFTIDFETTDKDPHTCHPVEIAVCPNDGRFITMLIKPPIPIPAEVSAIHHITDDDVREAKTWEEIKPFLKELLEISGKPILVAHNASYEQGVMKGLVDADWICTYKVALILHPDAPSHKNEVLRYHLGLSRLGRAYPQNAHNALHDTIVTQELLFFLIGKFKEMHPHASMEFTLNQFIAWSKEPARLSKMPFGKHAGLKWDMIPGDYLGWILQQREMDESVRHCAQNELTRRKGGGRATVKSH